MTESIDELALKVGLTHFDDFEDEGKYLMVDGCCINSQLLSFARALIAEYEADQGEAVAYITYKGYLLHADDPKVAEHSNPSPLYHRPDPRVKELEAEVAGLHEQLEEPQINADLLRILEAEKAELERQLAEASRDAEKWREYQARKVRLTEAGFGKNPLRDAAMKGIE